MRDHEAQPRIERGFVRREDERKRQTEARAAKDGRQPLSAALAVELTAHKTMALRDSLGVQPETALIAVTHALAAAAFFAYNGILSCLAVTARSAPLSSRAPQIDESPAGQRLAARHDAWAARMPEEAEGLWTFVAGLSTDDRMDLLAHCAALTIDAVRDTENEAGVACLQTQHGFGVGLLCNEALRVAKCRCNAAQSNFPA